MAARARKTLVLVHRKPLLDQWVAQLALFLGIDTKAIGQIGAGKRRPTGRIDVAMMQSLVRKGTVDDLVADYGHVIVDECHHLPAVSFERVLAEVKARYVTGLTATPYRRDGHRPIIHMQCGAVRFFVDPRSERGLFGVTRDERSGERYLTMRMPDPDVLDRALRAFGAVLETLIPPRP